MTAQSSPTVESILFDLDDTLVPFQTPAHWQWAWRPQGPILPERHVRAALHHALHAWDRRRWMGLVKRGPAVDWNAYREHLKETLLAVAGRSLPDNEVAVVVERFLKPAGEIERFPDVEPAIRQLRALGIKIAVLTPLPTELAKTLLRRVALSDVPVLSSEPTQGVPGVPVPALYRSAAKTLGLLPNRTAFVGDLFWSDYRAALRAGLRGFLLERPGNESRGEARRLSSLNELVGAIRAPPPDALGGGSIESGKPAST